VIVGAVVIGNISKRPGSQGSSAPDSVNTETSSSLAPAPDTGSSSERNAPADTNQNAQTETQAPATPVAVETTMDEFGCNKPAAPATVDGSTASEADMIAAANLAKSFIQVSDQYQDCLNRYGAQHFWKKTDTDASVEANQKEKENVGAAFNLEKRIFDGRGNLARQ
jgi:hypothetical protein